MRSSQATLTQERLKRLRQADAIVRQLSEESGFERQVWQFPVVLIPIGAGDRPDSVVLRPIHSVDGMTAQVVRMPRELLHGMTHELLAVNGICGVFYDLTHKPPGTIEWECRPPTPSRSRFISGESSSKYRALSSAARSGGRAGSSSGSRSRRVRSAATPFWCDPAAC